MEYIYINTTTASRKALVTEFEMNNIDFLCSKDSKYRILVKNTPKARLAIQIVKGKGLPMKTQTFVS